MITSQRDLFSHAATIAQRDQLLPFQATRQDTGDLIWFVQSRSDPTRYYLLTVSGETIQCACPQSQHHGICAHAAAVRFTLQAQQQLLVPAVCPQHNQSTPLQAPRPQHRPEPQMEQERRRRADAERRERALLWTDDQPFSIWKS